MAEFKAIGITVDFKGRSPVSNFLNTIASFRHGLDRFDRWIYRGHANAAHTAVPKAGRKDVFREQVLPGPDGYSSLPFGDGSPMDLQWFERWKRLAVGFGWASSGNDFEDMAIAQHYGLATRLMDWTSNPLMALFFAVEKYPDEFGMLYMFFSLEEIEETKLNARTQKTSILRVRPLDKRLAAQSGCFTYHQNPDQGLFDVVKQTQSELYKLGFVEIPSEFKEAIQIELATIGISKRTLFPDLDGLSAYVNWNAQVGRSV